MDSSTLELGKWKSEKKSYKSNQIYVIYFILGIFSFFLGGDFYNLI